MFKVMKLSALLIVAVISAACQEGVPTDVSEQTVQPVRFGAGPLAKNFVAPLDGSQEVPPVESGGTGVGRFQLNKDGTGLEYKLIVANIEGVVQAHIHSAARGANGPVVAFLFGFATTPVTTNGILAAGTITASDLIGPLVGQPLSALLDEMRSGDTYVNVHTVAHPPGQIRGQILVAGPDS